MSTFVVKLLTKKFFVTGFAAFCMIVIGTLEFVVGPKLANQEAATKAVRMQEFDGLRKQDPDWFKHSMSVRNCILFRYTGSPYDNYHDAIINCQAEFSR